jgi:hypothetical protein
VRRKRGLGRVAVQWGVGPVRCARKAAEEGEPNRGGANLASIANWEAWGHDGSGYPLLATEYRQKRSSGRRAVL